MDGDQILKTVVVSFENYEGEKTHRTSNIAHRT